MKASERMAQRYHHVAFATLAVVTLTATVRDLSAAPKVEMLNSHDGRTMAFSKPLLHIMWVNKCILKQRIHPQCEFHPRRSTRRRKAVKGRL